MEYRRFGKTDLTVSVIGFGAWGIGGPVMAGTVPIGWGEVDDDVSVLALRRAREMGVTFYDTADVYGFGHSEELIGRVFGGSPGLIIATKVGNRLAPSGGLTTDYSKEYILRCCEQSLRRLRRETIDYYQLHSARVAHLATGEPAEAMEQLRQEGKIRYWGISLNTFDPGPEADFFFRHHVGHGFQLVWNILNQRALPVIRQAEQEGYGVIARMPLQFGLLTGKFSASATFGADDHRSFRLTPTLLPRMLAVLEPAGTIAAELGISRTALAIGFCAGLSGVSTLIPGIKTPVQAEENCRAPVRLPDSVMQRLLALFPSSFAPVVNEMEKAG